MACRRARVLGTRRALSAPRCAAPPPRAACAIIARRVRRGGLPARSAHATRPSRTSQARHLLKKVLVKNHMDRASIQSVLKHAYLCGGMDTIQRDSSFGYLKQTQQQLQTMLSNVSNTMRS